MESNLQGVPAATPNPTENNASRELINFLYAVKRRRKLVVFAVAVSAAMGALYFATTPRIYESRGSLLFVQTVPPTISPDRVYVDPVEKMMDTYRSMVTSPKVLEKVVHTLESKHLSEVPGALPAQKVEWLRKNLRATVPRKTAILELSYRSRSPDTARAVVQRALSHFLEYMDESHKKPTGKSLELLIKERENLDEQINVTHRQLLELAARIGDPTVEEGGKRISVEGDRLMKFSRQALDAWTARQKAEVHLRCLEAAIQRDEDLRPFVSVIMGTAGQDVVGAGLQDVDSLTISRIQEDLLRLWSQVEASRKQLGDRHSLVQQLTDQIRIKEEFVRNVTRGDRLRERLWSTAKANLENAVAVEWTARQAYEESKVLAEKRNVGVSEREELSRQLEAKYKTREKLDDDIKAMSIAQQDMLVKTTPFSEPETPRKPVAPSLSLVVMVSLIAGLGGGLLLVYFVEMLDDRFVDIEAIQQQTGLRVLAMIPKLKSLEGTGAEAIYVHVRPTDSAVEGFHTWRTALDFVAEGARSLVVTSSEPGDGKTTLTVNLAATMAASRLPNKTLLMDVDLRRTQLTSMLGLQGHEGVSTVLRDKRPVADILPDNIRSELVPGLDVLPSGPRAADAAELLASERISEILSWAEQHYEYVLLDTPPAFIADAAMIGRLTDGTMLVLRPEKNQRKTVIRTVDRLNMLGVKMLGLVINHCQSDGDYGRGYGYKYGYGYGYGYSYNYNYGHDQDGEEEDAQEATAQQEAFAPKVQLLRRAG